MSSRSLQQVLALGALILTAGLLTPAPGLAAGGPPQEGSTAGQWTVSSDFEMYRFARGNGVGATTCLERTARGEETLDSCSASAVAGSHLQALFLEGAVVLVKGPTLEKDKAGPILDAPVLSVKFVLELMRRAFPEGPLALGARTLRTLKSADQSVVLYGDGNSMTLKAPWSLQAEAWPSPSGGVDFTLRWAGGAWADLDGPTAEEVYGHLGPSQPLPPLAPSLGLEGWTAYRVLQNKSFRLPDFASLSDLRQALPWLPLGEE